MITLQACYNPQQARDMLKARATEHRVPHGALKVQHVHIVF